MTLHLPAPVANYFNAANEGTPAGLAACFTVDGVVHDEGRQVRGHAAIAAWSAATRARYAARATPLGSEADAAGLTVWALVEGNFPGSPLQLHFQFRLQNDAIASLEIAA